MPEPTLHPDEYERREPGLRDAAPQRAADKREPEGRAPEKPSPEAAKLEAQLKEAHGKLEQTNAKLEQTNAKLEQANAKLEHAQAKLEQQREELTRTRAEAEKPRKPAAADPALAAELKQAQEKIDQQRDEMVRALAETENVRKRAQAEAAVAQKFALERFAGTLLPVLDSLEAALATENASFEALRSGVELTLKQMRGALERASIVEISPAQGERFDPHRHQAMAAVEADAEPNTVVIVMQKGYLLHERVLRPALVTVARQKVENPSGNPISDTSLDSGN